MVEAVLLLLANPSRSIVAICGGWGFGGDSPAARKAAIPSYVGKSARSSSLSGRGGFTSTSLSDGSLGRGGANGFLATVRTVSDDFLDSSAASADLAVASSGVQ